MWGDFGADRFQIAAGGGVDVIGDFDVVGGDTIRLPANVNGSGITNFATLVAHTVDQNGDAVIDLGGGNRLILDSIEDDAAAERLHLRLRTAAQGAPAPPGAGASAAVKCAQAASLTA